MAPVYWPLERGHIITSGYGPRWGTQHYGVDFGWPGGSANKPVYACQGGTVVSRAYDHGGFGHYLDIDSPTADGADLYVYGHIVPEVNVGQRVEAGQRIGHINGNRATNGGVDPHVHVERHNYVRQPPGPGRKNPTPYWNGALYPPRGAAAPAPKPAPTQEKPMTYFDVDWSPRFNFGRPRPLSGLRGVCIHTTENVAGTPAENVANYQINSQSGSYNVLVDTTGKRLRENTDDWQVWASGNKGNDILVHLSFVAQARWSRAEWLAQDRMLRAGATVVAHWCRTYKWPVKHVNVHQLPGITTHDATRAWGGTDHTDPGPNFPWDVFLSYVNEALGNSGPAPSPEGGLFMALSDAEQRELLAKTRDIHRELTQKYPSRSAYRRNDDNVDTLAGFMLNVDARIHESWVHDRAAEEGSSPDEFARKLNGGK